MLGALTRLAKAAFAVRKMRGDFNPMDLWWMIGMILVASMLLWFVLHIIIPDLPIWW